jgi:MATE family multidrug resistance protein
VSGLGSAALGGVGVATMVMYLSYALASAMMRGVKVLTAHAIGEGTPRSGFAFARAGIVLGIAIGAIVLVACRDVSGALLALGTDPAIVPYARDFLAAVTWGAPATCALAALIQHRHAVGDTRTPMIVGIGGNLFNAGFAWLLIYGRGGLPALGVSGAGYATTTTEALELAILLAMLVRDERRADGGASSLPLGVAIRKVAELGFPTGFQFAAETLAFTTFTVVLGAIGKEQIAAHQVALNIIRVSFLPGVAVAEAASVLVGRALGRRRLDEADSVARSGLAIAIGFMATCGVVFAFAGGFFGRLFSTDEEVVRTIERLLLVAAVFQVLDAVNIVYRGVLRGAKDVRVVAFIGVAVIWTFLPTTAYVLGKLCGLGAVGGWLGFIGETTFASLFLWRRWKNGSWRRAYAS